MPRTLERDPSDDPRSDRTTDRVRALARGLAILREVNRSGGARAGAVARDLGLPRPTVYRLLETLEELGYVVRGASDERFRVTRQASALGDGYDASLAVGQAATPILHRLGQTLVWPIDLSTYENAAMVIQETTHARSPMSIDRGMIGRRLPLLRTSAGRAYLAHCPQAELDVILRHLRRVDEPADRSFLEPRTLAHLLETTRARGYGDRVGGEVNARTSSIAVAIRGGDTVLGCLSIIWITSGLGMQEAVASFLVPLRDAADRIAHAVRSAAVPHAQA